MALKYSFVICLLFYCRNTYSQFPAVCNTQENLQSKTCCPNVCGGPTRGSCTNFTKEITSQWGKASPDIVNVMRDSPNNPLKGSVDSRFLWPTLVFDTFCNCSGKFGGYDCMECEFGWTGEDCQTRKTPVVRHSFHSLSDIKKKEFVEATLLLKNEVGQWSVIVEEPANYSSNPATLQNVSTYDFFTFLHYFATKGSEVNSKCKKLLHQDLAIDFAHDGPVFPVWHRRYLLTVEKEFQRIMNNQLFGLPYWPWEQNDKSPFDKKYYGIPSSTPVGKNVTGDSINSAKWNTICDQNWWNLSRSDDCALEWKVCNPAIELQSARSLQRGQTNLNFTYLPHLLEVKMALAAPLYDVPDSNGIYSENSPRSSFRNRLEGWIQICSAVNCVGRRGPTCMHNTVHTWVGGHMYARSSTINDPIFNIHHCNTDRIFESWIKRFNASSLPPYVPEQGGHPGKNKDDYIVPFFPVIKAGKQYSNRGSEEWGYVYDELVVADIDDKTILDCSMDIRSCLRCDANGTCTSPWGCSDQTCPSPVIASIQAQGEEEATDITVTLNDDDALALGLGLGLGLRFPLIIIMIFIIGSIVKMIRSRRHSGQSVVTPLLRRNGETN